MEDTLRTAGPSPGKSENIFIPNLISDQSISVDYDPIPPNSMTTPAVHVADIIVHQDVEQNVGGLMEEREPLDDDYPEGELNLTDEDFSLHVHLFIFIFKKFNLKLIIFFTGCVAL